MANDSPSSAIPRCHDARAATEVSSAEAFNCRAILFDLDGVLVNSAECVERTWREWSARHRLNPEEVIGIAHGRRTIETVRAIAPHLDALAEVEALEAKEALTTEGIYEIEGARELITQLPFGKWAIVTSGTRTIAEFRLKHVGIPIPPVMVCADEISHGKPQPEGYLTAASRLGMMPGDCVVIEDTPPGIEAAHNAHMRVIAVATTYTPDHLADADSIVERLTDLQIGVRGDAIQITT